jgi:hypothetical protein
MDIQMKTKTKNFTIAIILFCMFPAVSMNGQFNKGDGNVTKSERKINSFQYVEVEDGIDLYLTQGDENELVVEADQNLLQYVETKTESDVLKIYLSKNIFKAKSLKAHLKFKELKGLSASGGSDVETVNTLKLQDFSAICSGGSDIRLNIQTNELHLKVSGGSDGFMRGNAKVFKTLASDGSDIKAFDLETAECYVEVSGGSDAEVHATSKLFARGSGGSDISYKGSPENINSDMSGGSDLIHN